MAVSNRDFIFEATLTTRGPGPALNAHSAYRHQWGLYTLYLGGSEQFLVQPVGDVQVNKSQKGAFDVVLVNWLDVPIGAQGLSVPLDVQWIMDGRGRASIEQGGGFAALDVGNTGRAGVVMPDGYSYSSASGVFLRPVPEAATCALLAAGLVAAMLRSRSRRGAEHPLPNSRWRKASQAAS